MSDLFSANNVLLLHMNGSNGSTAFTDVSPFTKTVPTVPGDAPTVTWARVLDGDGDWFADVSVSNEAGSGEIKLQTTLLYNGAYCRLTSAIFQG